MSKKKVARKPKMPKFNGRPQVWMAAGDRIRVIEFDGAVRYGFGVGGRLDMVKSYGCTSMSTQRKSVKEILRYAKDYNLPTPKFVGYL